MASQMSKSINMDESKLNKKEKLHMANLEELIESYEGFDRIVCASLVYIGDINIIPRILGIKDPEYWNRISQEVLLKEMDIFEEVFEQ